MMTPFPKEHTAAWQADSLDASLPMGIHTQAVGL